MSERYDLIVVGAGMAGVAAANKCATQGWRVAIVDSLPYGGTCALRGCDPKKILRRGAEIIDSARLMKGKGIDTGGLSINWGHLMEHKHGFTDPVPEHGGRLGPQWGRDAPRPGALHLGATGRCRRRPLRLRPLPDRYGR